MWSHRPWLRLASSGVALAAPGIAHGFTPGRAVEPPPAVYASGPSQTGKNWELYLPSVGAGDYLCRMALHGVPQGAPRGFYYWGCYDPALDAVVLPQTDAWPSRREWDELRAHEWAHARGWRHKPNGRGTDWTASRPPRGAVVAAVTGAAGAP